MTETVQKARSLDETFDAFVCRPLGRLVAKWFMRTTVTANQVSGMAALCGVAAGIGFAMPWPLPGYGAFLMFTTSRSVFSILRIADSCCLSSIRVWH